MNGLEVIQAVRKEYEIIDRYASTSQVKNFLLSMLHHSMVDLLNECDVAADDFTETAFLVHSAIAKTFGVYACSPYFSLTGRHKILKPVPHVDGDVHVFMYNDLLRMFKKMSKKQIIKAAIVGLESGCIKSVNGR